MSGAPCGANPGSMTYLPTPQDSPFARLGGEAKVRAISERFYDAMTELAPALAKLHPCDEQGRVARESRDKFALFFIGWLGGPQDYIAQHGHPRLRMRHAKVPVDTAMGEAWMRCMKRAFDQEGVEGEVREFLETKLGEVAMMVRNQ
jgi:hemoglobin